MAFPNHLLYSLITILLLLHIPSISAQTIDPFQLNDEISKLNDAHKHKESILKLEKILNDPEATPFDKTHAYIQKANTYKRVYNYVVALANLEHAANEASKAQEHKIELETIILVEKMFIHFDQLENREVELILEQLTDEMIATLERETKAFYYVVLGVLASRKKDYNTSEKWYDMAIEILEKENPKHLPNIYSKGHIIW